MLQYKSYKRNTKAAIQQQDMSSWCFQGRLKFLGVFGHTVIMPQNTCTTQPASAIAFKCHFSKPSKIGNKSFIVY